MKNLKIYYLLRLKNTHIEKRDLRVTSNKFKVEVAPSTLVDIENTIKFIAHSDAKEITFEAAVTRKEDGLTYNATITCDATGWTMEVQVEDEKLECYPLSCTKPNIIFSTKSQK